MHDTIGSAIRRFRVAQGLRQVDLANSLGVTDAEISRLETGQTANPGVYTLMRIADALGISVADLISSPTSKRRIPILDWDDVGQWRAKAHLFPNSETETIMVTDLDGSNLFALKIESDEMTPVFAVGQVVVVDPDAEIRSNDYVVAQVGWGPDERNVLRVYKKFGESAFLQAFNPAYPDIDVASDNVYVAGKVVMSQQTFK